MQSSDEEGWAHDRRADAGGFAITVAFELVDGAYARFHRLVSQNAAQSVASEPGCLRFDVLTPDNKAQGCDVMLYEIYIDRAAFDRHLASAHFRTFDRETGDLVRRKTIAFFSVSGNAKPILPA